MYGSDPYAYDIDAAITAAVEKGSERLTRRGNLSADAAYWRRYFESPPTLDQLHTHARKFGVESVKETADALGVDMRNVAARSKSQKPRKRRTTENLRAQVLNLRERGLVPAAIADTLNVSDRRVNTILDEAA